MMHLDSNCCLNWVSYSSNKFSWVAEASLWPLQLELWLQPLCSMQSPLLVWWSRLHLWKWNPRLLWFPHAVHLHQSKSPDQKTSQKLLRLHRFDVACVQRWMQLLIVLTGVLMELMSKWLGIMMLETMEHLLGRMFLQLNFISCWLKPNHILNIIY